MNFKTMYLISREKYNALNRRLLGDDSENKRVAPLVEKGEMSGSVPNSEIVLTLYRIKRVLLVKKRSYKRKIKGWISKEGKNLI